jgi:hypothetical protein
MVVFSEDADFDDSDAGAMKISQSGSLKKLTNETR